MAFTYVHGLPKEVSSDDEYEGALLITHSILDLPISIWMEGTLLILISLSVQVQDSPLCIKSRGDPNQHG